MDNQTESLKIMIWNCIHYLILYFCVNEFSLWCRWNQFRAIRLNICTNGYECSASALVTQFTSDINLRNVLMEKIRECLGAIIIINIIASSISLLFCNCWTVQFNPLNPKND